jgi:hypothetical protein
VHPASGSSPVCAKVRRWWWVFRCKLQGLVAVVRLQVSGSELELSVQTHWCFQSQADVSRHQLPPCTRLHPAVDQPPPNPPAHGLTARLRWGDRLCAVCCRRRGACGRTDRALGWSAIGRQGARGQHAWVSLTSLSFCHRALPLQALLSSSPA